VSLPMNSETMLLNRIQYALPRGQTLPEDVWQRRHRGILTLLWLHVIGLPLFGIAQGYGVAHCLAEGAAIAVPATLATFVGGRKIRAALVSLGLLTSSALLVHFSGGYIEAHFHFFVMIVVLTLYEDWSPFLLAVAYVAIHHGLAGALDPDSVYNHPAGREQPWKWAGIHALFIAGAGSAGVLAWRLNEDVRHRLRSVVDFSPDAIFSTTLDPCVENWNRGAERIYGYSAEEIRGQHLSVLVPEDRRDEVGWIIEQVNAGKSVENFETVRVRKDGQRIDVSLTVAPTNDSSGRVTGYSAIARDITESKRAEQNLKEAREEADRLKREFFSLVSHELRTPLASIKGYSELMMGGDAGERSAEEQRFLDVIVRNTDRLERLVDDLLLLALVEAGTFTLETRDVDLGRLVSDCVEAARPLADDKNIDLTFEAEPVGNCSVDSHRLEQLLDNLISNALKYTPQGGQVSTRLGRENGRVRIEVEDSGIGIPAKEQQFLFDRFFRATTATSGAIPGIGLGLTIVKAIVEAHRGTVQVESEEGRGTTFRVDLPFEAGPQPRSTDGGLEVGTDRGEPERAGSLNGRR
jgi:PAS domain S-box-containing protein